MPTDAQRWRFLADHKLTLHTDGDGYRVHWVRKGDNPGNPPKFYPVSTGATADEAIDAAIERWEPLSERTIEARRRRWGTMPSSRAKDQARGSFTGRIGVRDSLTDKEQAPARVSFVGFRASKFMEIHESFRKFHSWCRRNHLQMTVYQRVTKQLP